MRRRAGPKKNPKSKPATHKNKSPQARHREEEEPQPSRFKLIICAKAKSGTTLLIEGNPSVHEAEPPVRSLSKAPVHQSVKDPENGKW